MRFTVDANGRRPVGVLRNVRYPAALRANMMMKLALIKAEELIEALRNDNAQPMLQVASDTYCELLSKPRPGREEAMRKL